MENKVTYMLSDTVVDNIARKVAEEPMEHLDKQDKRPQHVIDEEQVDEGILERHDRRQMEMFDDPDWNWSGQR